MDSIKIDSSTAEKFPSRNQQVHDLTLLKIKTLNISELSPTDLAKEYYKIYSEIDLVLHYPKKYDLK